MPEIQANAKQNHIMETGSYVDDWYQDDTMISEPSYNQELLGHL